MDVGRAVMKTMVIGHTLTAAKAYCKDHPVLMQSEIAGFRSSLEGFRGDWLFIILVDVSPPQGFWDMMQPYMQSGQVLMTMNEYDS